MNYALINKAILLGSDVVSDRKDKPFYEYLLLNNVAYYFSKYLSKKKTAQERLIVKAGDALNAKFIRTLSLIDKICKKNGLDYMLYKTYKYIPEAVDGDIDLFVKSSDFNDFMRLLEQEGFDCSESGPFKGECKKEGFCKVEPRNDVSFHGIQVLSEGDIWRRIDEVKIGRFAVPKARREIDVLGLLLNILYGPNYCRLYLYKILSETDTAILKSLVSDKLIKDDVNFLLSRIVNHRSTQRRYPLFVETPVFVTWWSRRILMSTKLTIVQKLKHLVFFFYSKYGWMFFNRLPFAHDWRIKYGS